MNVYCVLYASSLDDLLLKVFEDENASLKYAREVAAFYDPDVTEDKGGGWLAQFGESGDVDAGGHHRDVQKLADDRGGIGTFSFIGVRKVPLVRDASRYEPESFGSGSVRWNRLFPVGHKATLGAELFDKLERGTAGPDGEFRFYSTKKAAYSDLKRALAS